MKEHKPVIQDRCGAALFTVLLIVFSLSALLGTVTAMGVSRMFVSRQLADRIRAEAIAEAGVHEAYSVLATNFALASNPNAFPATAYGGGTYDVTVTNTGTDTVSIICLGRFGDRTAEVILDIRRIGGSEQGGGDAVAYENMVLSGGRMIWTGTGFFANGGRVHANGEFRQSGAGRLDADVYSSVLAHFNGAAGQVDGDVRAPRITGKTGKVTGDCIEESVDVIPIPEIDLTPYYNHALANGEVRNSTTFSGGYTPVGGVLWVNGNLNLSGSGVYNGSFIATGNIQCSGGPGHSKVSTFPALISRDGNIKIAGSGVYHGLVYARIGDIEITGASEVHGSIICGGEFKKSGAAAVFAYAHSTPVPPGGSVDEDERIVVVAWQK